jgi:hypothetical protein
VYSHRLKLFLGSPFQLQLRNRLNSMLLSPSRQNLRPQVPAEVAGTVDMYLLPKKVSPPSPVKERRGTDSDIDGEVLEFDSD